ncbi:MAG TPA: GyrI-like domain-containing protein [Bacteroidia bacterium]|jgi:AraC family transcriptional regulator|nr:GyrI-like domain-containing protein [Bacteroidia bacterium]
MKDNTNTVQVRIETLAEKKLVGKRKRMSLANNQTRQLWQSFMANRNEIKNLAGSELYSLEVYSNANFFRNFDPSAPFDKWAAVEVSSFDTIPTEMETIIIPAGLYAVFLHKGLASEGPKTYQYIFAEWLPRSAFLPDNRPHFAVMGEKYKPEDPASEEEIWIPVISKG